MTPADLTMSEADLAEMKAERDALTKALTGLLLGGSELFKRRTDGSYAADIAYITRELQTRREDAHRRTVAALKGQKAAEARIAEQKALVEAHIEDAYSKASPESGLSDDRRLVWATRLAALKDLAAALAKSPAVAGAKEEG